MQTNNQVSVEFAPACVVVSGKTVTERKVSVVAQASFQAITFLSAQKGTVGKNARLVSGMVGTQMIAEQARKGNYKPLADAIAALMGESLTISNRSAFESLVDRFNDKLSDLATTKSGGYTTTKEGITKPSARRAVLNEVVKLVTDVQLKVTSL